MCIHKFQNIILLLITIVVFAACDRNTPILEQMDMAENLMNTKPDSALTLLKDIPVTNIKGKEIAARHALLKSMALDKNLFSFNQPLIIISKKVLLMRNFGHIIIKAEYIRIRAMMILPCNLS